MTAEPVAVEYIHDGDVDARMDQQLRDLLAACFTKPGDEVFRERRYFREPPQHRWIVRGPDGRPIAHVAVHAKTIGSTVGDLAIAGVAEVCVHPHYRRRGLVRRMLAVAHEWLTGRGYAFAMLFGKAAVYRSSGYVTIRNPLRMQEPDSGQWVVGPVKGAMIRPIDRADWPAGPVDLCGPTF